jgi:hypothetical protein
VAYDPDVEFYEDQDESHPNGVHVVIVEPGVELHPFPAYKRAPGPCSVGPNGEKVN